MMAGRPTCLAGDRYRSETGLCQIRNRHRQAKMGRIVSRDPIGYDGKLNPCGNVGGNPASYVARDD